MSDCELKKKIKAYSKKKGTVTIPEIQVEFSLDYKDVAPIVHDLVGEKFMRLGDGLEYKVNVTSKSYGETGNTSRNARNYRALLSKQTGADSRWFSRTEDETEIDYSDEDTILALKILAFCIDNVGATLSIIKRAVSCSYMDTFKALTWLIDNDYIGSVTRDNVDIYESKLTREQYIAKFDARYTNGFLKPEKESVGILKQFISKIEFYNMFKYKYAYKPQQWFSMYKPKFDLVRTITLVPDLDNKVSELIDKAKNEPSAFAKDSIYSTSTEIECVNLIGRIIYMDLSWSRNDAVIEAAKELAAVEYAEQGEEARDVHARVFFDLLNSSDEDYEKVKKLINEN